jgi:RNA polymerase sigma-70 factor, ECF subfamily
LARPPVVETRSLAGAGDPLIVTLVNRAVATRDCAAFGQLYDRFVEEIYHYLCARCDKQADAENLTEQVFRKAWEGIDGYRWQGLPFQAWLYRLAHNAHIELVHTQPHAIVLDNNAHRRQSESATGTRELTAQLDPAVLARAVRHLTPKQQQVIHLRFMADLDTSEIAQIMGEQEGAIRALQMRGLMSLRRVLDQQGIVANRVSRQR